MRDGAGVPDHALVVTIDDSGRLGVPEVDQDLSPSSLGDKRGDHGDAG